MRKRKNEIKTNTVKERAFDKKASWKTADQEFFKKPIKFTTEKQKAQEIKKLKKWAADNDYTIIEREEDVLKVFPDSYHYSAEFNSQELFFLIWNKSGVMILLETEEDEKYVDSLTDADELKVMRFIRENEMYQRNYVINDYGQLELTKNGKICERKEKDGKAVAVWVVGDGSAKAHTRNVAITINQIPTTVIKSILKK